MKYFRIDVLVKTDRAEESLAQFIEGILAQHRWHFAVKDLSVYEVSHMEGHG